MLIETREYTPNVVDVFLGSSLVLLKVLKFCRLLHARNIEDHQIQHERLVVMEPGDWLGECGMAPWNDF